LGCGFCAEGRRAFDERHRLAFQSPVGQPVVSMPYALLVELFRSLAEHALRDLKLPLVNLRAAHVVPVSRKRVAR
jgi:hypothetical protein